jgi:DNA-binding transcriptional ArsR family regulator
VSEPDRRVLIHPLRRRLLLEYASGPVNPAELARRLDQPLTRVSYHTRVLLRHGYLVPVAVERRRGGATHLYAAAHTTAIEDGQWEQLPAATRRALTLGTLEQVFAQARGAALDGAFDSGRSHLSRSPLELDEPGIAAAADRLRAAFDDIAAAVDRSRERAAPVQRPFELVVLAFEPPA